LQIDSLVGNFLKQKKKPERGKKEAANQCVSWYFKNRRNQSKGREEAANQCIDQQARKREKKRL